MAIRLKTIEYPFTTNTAALTAGVRHDFSAVTIYIPENSSRTFKSAIIQVTCRTNSTSGTSNITAWLMGIKLGAVAFNDVTVTDTITQTGEHQSYFFTRDVTSYFNTNFGSGTSETCQVGVQFTSEDQINITAKLILTYEYSDTSQTTRIKTVRLPIESILDRLTNSLAELGTNQVPDLDALLPEASKTYRQIWFEMFGNESSGATTNFNLAVSLDAEGEATRATLVQNANSSCWYYDIWIRNDLDTSTTHAFKARTTTTNRMAGFGAVLCVTYEYDHSSTTSVINSLVLPSHTMSTECSGTASTEKFAYQTKFLIAEPSTITLVQSGIIAFGNHSGTATIAMGAGSQSTRSYVNTAGGVQCGQYSWIHRIDSGGGSGSNGITLARGENTLNVYLYGTSVTTAYAQSGYLILNYTSGLDGDGDGVHAHSVCMNMSNTVADSTRHALNTLTTIAIPESNYYINGFLTIVNSIHGTTGHPISLTSEYETSEWLANGWAEHGTIPYSTDSERGICMWCFDCTPKFRRYPNDSTDKQNIETARNWRIVSSTNFWQGALWWVTYHAITFTVSGTVYDYSGDGSGITITLHNATTGVKLDSTTTSAGGTFTMTWYDDVTSLFTQARQSSSLLGRSDNTTAT